MSKIIDFSKPLSEEDKQYVADRPWLLTDAKLQGFDVRDEDEFFTEGEDDESDPEDLENESDEESEDDQSDDESEESEEDEVAPYEEWEYQALKDAAGERGLAKSGSKEQLIKRLEDHDAELESESE